MDTIFKEGDKVFDIMLQKWGVVLKINDTKVDYPIHVQYIDGLTYYSLEGHYNVPSDKQPRLSFTECTIFDGKFTQERPLPDIEVNTLVYVKLPGCDLCDMRYFSHF